MEPLEEKRSRLQKIICEAVDRNAAELKELSNNIWANPELGYTEFFAHEQLTRFLDGLGNFSVERHHAGIETSFRAQYQQRKTIAASSNAGKAAVEENRVPHVAFLCEYDALPDIGHACGHNLIAEAGKVDSSVCMAELTLTAIVDMERRCYYELHVVFNLLVVSYAYQHTPTHTHARLHARVCVCILVLNTVVLKCRC